MDSDKDFKLKSLTAFLNNQILPHLSEWQRDSLKGLDDAKMPEQFLREDYEKLLSYDPVQDKGRDFFSSVIFPFYILAINESGHSFDRLHQVLLEKAKVLAEVLFRDAFFRNRYDTLEAWQSCASYKEYRALLKNLDALPAGAEERVAGMSKQLDELWARPEVERAFENANADDLVESGANEKSMLVQMYREESKPVPEAGYGGYHDLRPDLFPENYADYVKELEERRHPYILKL